MGDGVIVALTLVERQIVSKMEQAFGKDMMGV